MQKKNFQGWRILSDISVLSLLCDKYETKDFFFHKWNMKTNTTGRYRFSRSTKWYIHYYNFWVCSVEPDRSNTCMGIWHTRIFIFFPSEILLKKPTWTSIALWLKPALRCALSIGMVFRKFVQSKFLYSQSIVKTDRFSEHFSTFLISNHILISLL